MAIAVVELACDAAAELGAPRVDAVHVAIGPLSGIVEEALRFSFEVAAAGTPAEGAALRIRHVPLTAFCVVCEEEVSIATPQRLRCPVCDTPTPDIRSGRELQVVAMEVPDVADSGDSSEHSEEERPARG